MGWRARWRPSAEGAAPAAAGATVFISHSIIDSDAARRVEVMLEGTGHPVWRFQERLRGGSPWYDEMLDAVVRKDVVLFLASRASVASPSCRDELVCAQQHGKRIVVISLDPGLREADLPEDMRFVCRTQWIKWTDEPIFAAEIDTAVSTDFDRVRLLTRLDVRATDWHAAGRPNRTILRGAELAAAEKLLSVTEESQPATAAVPSRVGREFVERSQRQRRRRRILGVVVGSAVVLALIASSLYAVDRSQQEEMARRGELVQHLRSEAARVGRADPASSLRLQIAAYSLDRTPSGRALLARDLLASNLRRYLPERGNKTRTLTYAADGNALFSAGFDGTLRVYSSDGHRPVAAIPLGTMINSVAAAAETGTIVVSVDGRILIQQPSPSGPPVTISDTTIDDVEVGRVAVSPNGRLLATGTLARAAGLLTVSESSVVQTAAKLPPTGGVVTGVAFSHSGRLLAVADEYAVTVWDVTAPATPVQRKVIELAPPASAKLSFSPDDRLLAVGNAQVGVYELTAQARDPVYTVPLQSQAVDIAFAPGPGAVLAVTDQDTMTSLWDVDARASAPTNEFRQQGIIPYVLAFSPDGRYLAVGGEDGSVTEWLVHPRGEPKVLASGAGPGEISGLALTPTKRLVAVSSAMSGVAQLYRLEAGTSQLVGTTPDLGRDRLSAVTFHDGSPALAVGDFEGFLGLVDVATLDPATARVGTQPDAKPVGMIEFSANGSLLATGDGEGPGFLWRVTPESLTLVGEVEADFGPAPLVRFRPDGKRLAVGGLDGKTVLYDITDSAVAKVGTLPSDDDRKISLLSWLPDGEHIAVGTELGIRLFSVSDPAAPALMGAAREAAAISGLALVLLPDLPLMAVWGSGRVTLWNIMDPRSPILVADWAAGTAEGSLAVFSSDGEWLAVSDLTEWTVFDLTDSLEPAGDPVPAACLAAASIELTEEFAEAVAEFDPDDPCRG